jgi:predicted metal-dependent enzyme (double-stranded beta helix superfamily)
MGRTREYALADLVRDMRAVVADANGPAEIVARLVPPARRLALARGWLEPRFFAADPAQGFGIVALHEAEDHGLFVVVAALLPGRSLPPHNHRTWALQAGIVGTETNVSWRRTDDQTRPGYAVVEEAGRTVFGPGEVVTFLPDDIHSVSNEGREVALSLNLYGLSYPYTGASRFDPVHHTERPLLS